MSISRKNHGRVKRSAIVTEVYTGMKRPCSFDNKNKSRVTFLLVDPNIKSRLYTKISSCNVDLVPK